MWRGLLRLLLASRSRPHCLCCLLSLQAQVLEADDPRVAWAAQNAAALQQREADEAAKKVELLAAAKEYLEKVNKVGF